MKKATLIAATLLLFACSSNTKKDFSQVIIGDSKENVTQKVGDPDKKAPNMLADIWQYDNDSMTVVFGPDGKVNTCMNTKKYWDIMDSAMQIFDNMQERSDSIDKSVDSLINSIMNE